ncbi:MAG TPA: hypothetical protein VFM59_02070 [Salinimicrobium sp.]|nr:hypothetical protein [Salinimicrobium sp.]
MMASLVLFSTMSFSVEKHFCGKILIDQAIFSEVESCCMEMHRNSSGEGMDEDSCCNEEKISVEGQDELKISFDKLDLSQQVFLASFAFTFVNLFEGLPQQVIPFKHYSPPLLVSDIQLLDQTFLI